MNVMPFSNAPRSRRDVLRLESLKLLKDFAHDLIGIEDLEALLWAVAERTISKLGWEDCVIYLKDPCRDVLIQKAAYGPKSVDYKAIFKPIEIPLGRGVVGRVGMTGESICIADTAEFSDYITDDAVRMSELAVPIMLGEEVLGVIDSEHRERDFYTPEDQTILETIAGITATKIQNARSTRTNEELALFYKRNPNPVLQLNEELEISFINESARHYFPNHPQVGDRIQQPHLVEALQEAKASSHSVWRCHLRTDGREEERVGEFNIVHLESGQFNLYGSDITHILQLQNAAEAANEAKSRFLSVMSHEIRTPLNAILGLTDLLIHEAPNREEQLRHLTYMEFSGKHLLGLVNDILDLEKLASGKESIVRTDVKIKSLLDSIVDSFQNRAEKVGLGLSLEMTDCPETILTDVKWLTQILNNLLSNAIKYTEQGTVCLKVHPLSSTQQGEGASPLLRFSVIDTGKGIPESEIERIIQPFEQIRNHPSIEGTGLGLAIVNNLVMGMNGEMTVESEVDSGSAFHIDLPMEVADSAVAPDNPKSGTGTSHEATSAEERTGPLASTSDEQSPSSSAVCPILLADDNELNRFVASKLLMRWGFEIHEAVDGAEAVRVWNELGPCLILMDVQMPIMDGIEATKAIRMQEEERSLPASPIIALTANTEEKTHEAILACGMDERIVKPFDPPTLKALIERTLAMRNPRAL